jgi:Uma2 family endonuclease
MTAEEFAVWAEARPEKHWELFDGEPVLQQSQNWGHAQHIMSLAMAFREEIAAARLTLFVGTRGLVVKAGPHTAFEPDVVVFAGPMDDHDIIVPRPVIVVEVLSDSTARKDRTVKLDGYCAVPTIEHYLLVDWEEREISHYRREGSESPPPLAMRKGRLTLDPPGLTLDISKVFEDR